MQTWLAPEFQNTAEGREADAILRSCVHCGFCTAVCPTYNLLGDELDSPRGRIYLIKGLLEGEDVGAETQQHLDRCLTCRACETACPSGVQFARLADIGRTEVEKRVLRPLPERMRRYLLRWVITSARRFSLLLGVGRLLRPILPQSLQCLVPIAKSAGAWPVPCHARRVLVPAGCVQPALEPGIDRALARLLDRHGISAVRIASGCCGAVSQHLAAPDEALQRMRANIDAWWPHVENGAEAIVETSSACGVMVREYGHLLRNDPDYAEKATRISALCRDPAELLDGLPLAPLGKGRRIAFQAPCSLQNGLKLEGRVEAILRGVGFELLPVEESSMCCGSAGTYSVLQPALSGALLTRKLGNLHKRAPELIVTANIGCLAYLQRASKVPVVHWLELLE
jgi:glycolate oxidase iron-sulfur subunit